MGTRNQRSERGAMLALITTSTFFITLLGIGFGGLLLLIGGQREVDNATSSGSLNVAKKHFTEVSVGLEGTEEQENFEDLLKEDNGRVSLRNINKIIGYTTLVCSNARFIVSVDERSGNTEAIIPGLPFSFATGTVRATPIIKQRQYENALEVLKACQKVSRRLREELRKANNAAANEFAGTSRNNSLKTKSKGCPPKPPSMGTPWNSTGYRPNSSPLRVCSMYSFIVPATV